MATYSEQLVEVQTAITAILTGAQAYSVAGRSLTRADLKALLDERKRLEPLAARESGTGGIRVYGATPVDN